MKNEFTFPRSHSIACSMSPYLPPKLTLSPFAIPPFVPGRDYCLRKSRAGYVLPAKALPRAILIAALIFPPCRLSPVVEAKKTDCGWNPPPARRTEQPMYNRHHKPPPRPGFPQMIYFQAEPLYLVNGSISPVSTYNIFLSLHCRTFLFGRPRSRPHPRVTSFPSLRFLRLVFKSSHLGCSSGFLT